MSDPHQLAEEEREEPLRPVPDLAGLPAADAHGRFFGEVYGALADAGTGLIRYLDLDLHGTGKHVLVPIGHARIQRHGEEPEVRLRAATREELATIPPYEPDRGTLSDPEEEALLAAHGRFFSGERYYAHPAFDHSGLYAGEHPIVGDGVSPTGAHLEPLSALSGYDVAEGEPDIRDWRVIAADDEPVGTVEELIVDPQAHKVRYAEIRLDGGRVILLPVGLLHVEPGAGEVVAKRLAPADLDALPPRPAGAIDRADEDALRQALDARLDGERRVYRPDFRQAE